LRPRGRSRAPAPGGPTLSTWGEMPRALPPTSVRPRPRTRRCARPRVESPRARTRPRRKPPPAPLDEFAHRPRGTRYHLSRRAAGRFAPGGASRANPGRRETVASKLVTRHPPLPRRRPKEGGPPPPRRAMRRSTA
jgi:hypothetical protein